MVEERISKLKDISIEIIKSEEKKNQGKIIRASVHVGYHHMHNRSPRRGEKICEKTIAKDIPDLMKNLIYRSKKFNEFQVG